MPNASLSQPPFKLMTSVMVQSYVFPKMSLDKQMWQTMSFQFYYCHVCACGIILNSVNCWTLLAHPLEHCLLFTAISGLLNRSDCSIGSHIHFVAACQNIDAEFELWYIHSFLHPLLPNPHNFYSCFCNKCLHWQAGHLLNQNYWSHGQDFKALMHMLEALGYERCSKQSYCYISLSLLHSHASQMCKRTQAHRLQLWSRVSCDFSLCSWRANSCQRI